MTEEPSGPPKTVLIREVNEAESFVFSASKTGISSRGPMCPGMGTRTYRSGLIPHRPCSNAEDRLHPRALVGSV